MTMAGQWQGNGMAMAWQWRGAGLAMAHQWHGNGMAIFSEHVLFGCCAKMTCFEPICIDDCSLLILLFPEITFFVDLILLKLTVRGSQTVRDQGHDHDRDHDLY